MRKKNEKNEGSRALRLSDKLLSKFISLSIGPVVKYSNIGSKNSCKVKAIL